MDRDPEIVVHAPLPEPTDAGVGYDAAGEAGGHGRGGEEERKTLPPDPYHVLLQSPFQLFDADEQSRLVTAIKLEGATTLHVELGESAPLNSELIQGLRQLGTEAGVSRIDVHGHHEL